MRGVASWVVVEFDFEPRAGFGGAAINVPQIQRRAAPIPLRIVRR
jgi:hypothetical protein